MCFLGLGRHYNIPIMSATASIMLLLEQNPFVSELEYDGFELTERERQQCALYRQYLQAAHAIARAQEAPASLDTETIVAHMHHTMASCALSLICSGLDSDSGPSQPDSDSSEY